MNAPEIDARRLGEAIGHAMARIGDLQADLGSDFDSDFTAQLGNGRLELRLTLTVDLDLGKFQHQEPEPKPDQPRRAGRPWSDYEDDLLLAAHRDGASMRDMARRLERSEDECRVRLAGMKAKP